MKFCFTGGLSKLFRGYASDSGVAAKNIGDQPEKHSFSAHRAAEPLLSNYLE